MQVDVNLQQSPVRDIAHDFCKLKGLGRFIQLKESILRRQSVKGTPYLIESRTLPCATELTQRAEWIYGRNRCFRSRFWYPSRHWHDYKIV
jgi:hypothetical protein